MDDGVYNLNHEIYAQFIEALSLQNIYTLTQHAVARNINIPTGSLTLDMASLVTLSAEHVQSITWQ